MILLFFFYSVDICNMTLLLFVERNIARILCTRPFVLLANIIIYFPFSQFHLVFIVNVSQFHPGLCFGDCDVCYVFHWENIASPYK